jgi:hypothetical protein
MGIISFLVGKKYGESNKKGKKKILASIGMLILVFFALLNFMTKEFLLLGLSLIGIVFLYIEFIR